MQSGKNAMESAKEAAANVAASAKSGMEKTKATLQEKTERMTAHDPIEKEVATERKQEKKTQAELNKQAAREQNAAARQAAATGGGGYTPGGYTTTGTGTATYSTTGVTGHPTGTHQVSAMPGHGTGQVTEGVAGSHPVAVNTGTGRTTAHNPRAGGNVGSGYDGTGGT
ncbi:hypothetical protein FNV43_RR16555 [Rhamnella rubrinervis]|uniref:Uncharacterized protein n=1 Tax=Rhamnella rubrinervis TaxID=2594499 RepID=A0A8K0MC65_9ROSA|nr:hypothetical protein FNV43_RR16555 [Rhamnella rubrinervis]